MKCPNCRCVVPGNLTICSYCGYDFSADITKTVSVEKLVENSADYYSRMDYMNREYYRNYDNEYAYNSEYGDRYQDTDYLFQNSSYTDNMNSCADWNDYSRYNVNNLLNDRFVYGKIHKYRDMQRKCTDYGSNDNFNASLVENDSNSAFISRNTLLIIMGLNIVFLVLILELLILLL